MSLILISVIFGLSASVGYGLSDYIGAKVTRKIGEYKIILFSHFLGLFLLVPLVLITKTSLLMSPSTFFLFIIYGLLAVIAIFYFYKALKIGPVSLVTPIAASYSLVSVISALLFYKEKLVLNHYLAIFLIIFGIIITSFKIEKQKIKLINTKGIFYAFIPMFLWGISIPYITFIIKEIGWISATFYEYLLIMLFIYFYILIKKIDIKNIRFTKDLIGFAFFRFLGFSMMNIGLLYGLISVVAPVESTSPLITVILALIFLKEKIQKHQLVGAFITIAGLIFLSTI